MYRYTPITKPRGPLNLLVLQVRVRLWSSAKDASRAGLLILDASSDTAAVEVGGGPWWEPWQSEARMREPLKSAVGLPIDVEGIASRLPKALRPRGL